MKNYLKRRKSNAAYLLVILIFMQSCVAYQSAPSTLHNSVDMGPVKIINQAGSVYKFKSVELREGQYIGTGSVYADLKFSITPDGAFTALDSTQFNAIYLKDAKRSKRQSVWLGVGITLPVAYLLLGFIIFLSFGAI